MMNKMMNKVLAVVMMAAMVLVVWNFKWYLLAMCVAYSVVFFPVRYIKGARK